MCIYYYKLSLNHFQLKPQFCQNINLPFYSLYINFGLFINLSERSIEIFYKIIIKAKNKL